MTSLTQQIIEAKPVPVRPAAWYTKPCATFLDTIALMRRRLWSAYLMNTLCYAA